MALKDFSMNGLSSDGGWTGDDGSTGKRLEASGKTCTLGVPVEMFKKIGLTSSSHKTGCDPWRLGVPRTSTHLGDSWYI